MTYGDAAEGGAVGAPLQSPRRLRPAGLAIGIVVLYVAAILIGGPVGGLIAATLSVAIVGLTCYRLRRSEQSASAAHQPVDSDEIVLAERFRDEARTLYAQLSKGSLLTPRDPRPWVLAPGEQIDIRVDLYTAFGVAHHGAPFWVRYCSATVGCTNDRLLVRSLPDGEVVDYYWDLVKTLEVDLRANTVVLGFDVDDPVMLYGPATPIVAVYVIWRLRGAEDFLDDRDLSLLR